MAESDAPPLYPSCPPKPTCETAVLPPWILTKREGGSFDTTRSLPLSMYSHSTLLRSVLAVAKPLEPITALYIFHGFSAPNPRLLARLPAPSFSPAGAAPFFSITTTTLKAATSALDSPDDAAWPNSWRTPSLILWFR